MDGDDPTPRALTFGSAAQAYARFRPGYPDELVDHVLTGLTPRSCRAVEIGAGTGKATTLFASRGVDVTAVEPDARMRAVLSERTADLPVTVVDATLETLPEALAQDPVDLLYAAAAWHWTDPATRWSRAAALLREGGVFASFGGPQDLVDPDLAAAVDRVRSQFMETDQIAEASIARAPTPQSGVSEASATSAPSDFLWPGDELKRSPWFSHVTEFDLGNVEPTPADDFVGLLSTVSAYLVLPKDERLAVLRAIRRVLPETVDVRRDLMVHRAIRTGVGTTAGVSRRGAC